MAKYATKGAETTTGTIDRRLRFLAELAQHGLTDHARRMIHTAWHLGTQPQHTHFRLRQWAHMLGFRGHFSTRTRHYSTPLTHLRAERTTWRTRQDDTQERPADGRSVTDQHSDRVTALTRPPVTPAPTPVTATVTTRGAGEAPARTPPW
ncbi:replication initiator [Streptacidiphilus cavernicola]|uniref:Replication initiator n=1 Tax=Streptacidiphilus cavernicola TaxID=3342716 RepID=A0ABV6VS51_9ACTN